MTDTEMNLALKERVVLGKGLNKLRKEGLVPVVIHDHGNPSIHAMVEYQLLAKLYENAGKHHPVNLTVGKRKEAAIIKDVHFDPAKHLIQHVVFQAIRQNETVETEVPVVFEGEIPAEKAGLLVITHLSHVAAEALPKDLPDQIVLNVESLAEVNDKLSVSDLTAPTGVTILTEPETLIVSVEESKAQLSAESDEEAAEAAAEGAEEKVEDGAKNEDTEEE